MSCTLKACLESKLGKRAPRITRTSITTLLVGVQAVEVSFYGAANIEERIRP
jgi:hypothetical protein